MFDTTERKSFEDVLDKVIKFLRQIKYINTIILFGTISDRNTFPMTDEDEIKYLIDMTEIVGKFYKLEIKLKKKNVILLIV